MNRTARYTHRVSIFLLALALFSYGTHAQEPKTSRIFRAGAATSNITPWLGVSIAGHMRDRAASYVHDELHVRCLVLDDGGTRLAFAIVDSCMVPRDLMDEAKRLAREATKIPVSNMLVSATHTHTAACATPVFQSDPDPDYARFLARRIADGIAAANHNLEPARIGWGSGSLPDEVFNRRWFMKPGTVPADPFGKTTDRAKMNPPRASADLAEPTGPTDPEISFIAAKSIDGRPIALLANYSLHYVGGTGPNHISADYFGIFADRIQELLEADRLDPPFVGVMTNGTSGDINNINFRKPGIRQEPYEQMTIVAHKAAAQVHQALENVTYKSWVPLKNVQQEIQLGVRRPSPNEVAEAREIMEAAEGPDMKTYPEIYARETVLLSEYPETVPVLLQTFGIGDLAIAAIPCEVFVEIGLAIKRESPFAQTFTIELANGYNGYLPTTEQHALGGYETWRARSSYLEVEADRRVFETVTSLLDRLKE